MRVTTPPTRCVTYADAPSLRTTTARGSRGTPRIANRLLRRVRDYAEVKAGGRIEVAVADAALGMLDVDSLGFDLMDRKLLRAVIVAVGVTDEDTESRLKALGCEFMQADFKGPAADAAGFVQRYG